MFTLLVVYIIREEKGILANAIMQGKRERNADDEHIL
jgi:hypothetical protein